MPFKSEKQRRFLYSQHPEIAKRWSKEEKQAAYKRRLKKRKKKRHNDDGPNHH